MNQMMTTRRKIMCLDNSNPSPLLMLGHRKQFPEVLQPTNPFNNGDSRGVMRPRVPVKIWSGVIPQGLCACVCVCWWGSMTSHRVLTTHLAQYARVGRTFSRVHLPPWLMMWVWGGGVRKFLPGVPPLLIGGGGDDSLLLRRLLLILQRPLPSPRFHGQSPKSPILPPHK